MGKVINYDGMRINKFIVVKRDHKDKNGHYVFLCKCDCGKDFFVSSGNIRRNLSCGCESRRITSERRFVHGESHSRLYRVWYAMKGRCYNPHDDAYKDYGGRGIKMCDEWMTYTGFRKWALDNGYDEKAERRMCTLDRIDFNGNYEPSNCRWVDMRVQSNNKRSNRLVTLNGETHNIAEWSKIVGIKSQTIIRRLNKGWSNEDALTLPLQRNHKNK